MCPIRKENLPKCATEKLFCPIVGLTLRIKLPVQLASPMCLEGSGVVAHWEPALLLLSDVCGNEIPLHFLGELLERFAQSGSSHLSICASVAVFPWK